MRLAAWVHGVGSLGAWGWQPGCMGWAAWVRGVGSLGAWGWQPGRVGWRSDLQSLRVLCLGLGKVAGAEGLVAGALEPLELLNLVAHLARARVVGVELERLAEVLERILELADAVERLAAHAQQRRLLRAAGLAHPPRRLGDDL